MTQGSPSCASVEDRKIVLHHGMNSGQASEWCKNAPVRINGQLECTGFLAKVVVDFFEPEAGGEHGNGLVGRCEVDDATSKDLAGDS